MSTFEALDQHTVRELAHRLAQRVEERFPTRGLTQAAKSLAGYSDLVAEETKALGAKNFLLQGVLALLSLVGIGAVIYVARGVVDVSASRSFTLAEFLQSLDATFNIVILTTLALAFVLNQAKRKKQRSEE